MAKPRHLDLGKAAVLAIVINALQIALVCGAVGYAILSPKVTGISAYGGIALAVMGFITCWGAAVDIREAIAARRTEQEADMLEEANARMDALNLTLRRQRHDFMNHLQVVYGLMEMDEKQAAIDYLEDVYKDLQQVSRVLKSGVPAVNALLAAKLADCQNRGVRMELNIESAWEKLPMEGFEVCRVLGNLIDNALDALADTPDPCIRVSLGGSLKEYTFSVANNGPMIPERLRDSLFSEGVTTKAQGHGMGLAIVRSLMDACGGSIAVQSSEEATVFSGRMPKRA